MDNEPDEEFDDEIDEDFDISAIYVLGKSEFDFNSPEARERTNRAIEEAMRECRRMHKEAGIPMVVSDNGEIVRIQPNDIEID